MTPSHAGQRLNTELFLICRIPFLSLFYIIFRNAGMILQNVLSILADSFRKDPRKRRLPLSTKDLLTMLYFIYFWAEVSHVLYLLSGRSFPCIFLYCLPNYGARELPKESSEGILCWLVVFFVWTQQDPQHLAPTRGVPNRNELSNEHFEACSPYHRGI